jgi:predicted heme/steroid binding protein
MCGLQLPSNGIASVAFRGRVVDQDQSSVWPAGTCLGIRDGKATEVPVQCALPHALEITGAIDLSTVFDLAAPSTAAQDAVVRDACGAATSEYLSPLALEATGLTLRYQPIAAKGWDAGSRRIACRIGSAKPDGGWATLLGTAKTGVLIDGQPAATLPSPAVLPSPVELPGPPEPPPAETTAPVIEAQQSSPSPEAAPPPQG